MPTISKSLTRKIYEASCLEYARTNETNALVDYTEKIINVTNIRRGTYLVMKGSVSHQLGTDLLQIHVLVRIFRPVVHPNFTIFGQVRPFFDGNFSNAQEI
jgi:hypothetical protein